MNESTYYLLKNDAPDGPYTLIQLRGMWLSGAVNGAMQYCEAGASEWRPLGEIQGVLEKTTLGHLTMLGKLCMLWFILLGLAASVVTVNFFPGLVCGVFALICWRFMRLSPGVVPKKSRFTPLQWVLILIALICFVLAFFSWLTGR